LCLNHRFAAETYDKGNVRVCPNEGVKKQPGTDLPALLDTFRGKAD
jgi:hypothetical protein